MTVEFFFATNARRFLYLLVSTPLALILGILLGKPLLPWIQAAAVFPLYLSTLSKCKWKLTFFLMAGWAVLVAVLVGLFSFCCPGLMENKVLNGTAYRQEMFHWIATGIGPEGDIRQFLPDHILHFLVFTILTLISGGFLGLVMGSSLMNYMSFYAGSLLLEARSTNIVLLLAWPPWAISRVAGFILLAMVMSTFALTRFRIPRSESRQIFIYALVGLCLLVLDVALKWSLADTWRQLIRSLTDL